MGGDICNVPPYMRPSHCPRCWTIMLTTHPFDDDKLREECGVFGIHGADSAAAVVALGLHALQHRGQEAAGITAFDGKEFHTHRAMGHVAGNFDRDDIMRQLQGGSSVGHVRYSTTGETALRNVQPLFADLSTGGFAVAHNGNISNAMKLRRELVRRGSIDRSRTPRHRDDWPTWKVAKPTESIRCGG